MQIAVAVLEVLVDLALAQPVVVQVIETRIGELGVERPQLREVERIVLAVVDPGQELHQAARLSGTGMRLDRRFDLLEGRHGAAHSPSSRARVSIRGRSPAAIAVMARSNSSSWLAGMSASTWTFLPEGGSRVILLMGRCPRRRTGTNYETDL